MLKCRKSRILDFNFINLASKRKRLDARYFVELTWLEDWLEKMNITLKVFNQFEYTKANIVSAQLANYMKSMNNSTIERLPDCSIMMDGTTDLYYIVSKRANGFKIREVILSAMVSYEEKMLEKGDIDQAAMVRNINIAFSSILFDQSSILLGKTREWELLRGVYNNRLNKITNDKDDFQLMGPLLRGIEKQICTKRCEEVINLEKKKGIGKDTIKIY
ncbi:hypothetical protein GLOIN_2v1476761 [Rhizophagus irregularis DAOM 181602=DAOM 197198]|nr:hypothetical protein GLOIN_2v1476761 [Rhizophagus irregularis DAOM 181602=DAOM 197198]